MVHLSDYNFLLFAMVFPFCIAITSVLHFSPKSIYKAWTLNIRSTEKQCCVSKSLPIIDWLVVCQTCAHSLGSREWRDSQRWILLCKWSSASRELNAWIRCMTCVLASARCHRPKLHATACLTTVVEYDFDCACARVLGKKNSCKAQTTFTEGYVVGWSKMFYCKAVGRLHAHEGT